MKKHELGELDDGEAHAERQANAGGDDSQCSTKIDGLRASCAEGFPGTRTPPPCYVEERRRQYVDGRLAGAQAVILSLSTVVGYGLVVEQLLQLALLEHLADDVAATDELRP